MAANFGSDPWLDARLRNVPLPVGMLQRLSQIANPSEQPAAGAAADSTVPAADSAVPAADSAVPAAASAALGNAVPTGAMIGQSVSDEALDGTLRDVALPAGFLE